MGNADFLPPSVLKRKAVVYVRQSTQAQVQTNLENKRRQYELVDAAPRRGFCHVEVIDDDQGRSASGTMARPGFERLVAALCAGEIGAVLCLDASRLARNGRDWHRLLELCGLVEARVIDLDGVYDPGRPNDRLLLGLKGSMSGFELEVLRCRTLDATRNKARRAELRISVQIGFVWHREIGLGFDPDQRFQEVIHLIFARFRELDSARQVLLSLAAEGVCFPRASDGKSRVREIRMPGSVRAKAEWLSYSTVTLGWPVIMAPGGMATAISVPLSGFARPLDRCRGEGSGRRR